MQWKFLPVCLVVTVYATTLHAQRPWYETKECSVVEAGYKFSFTLYKELTSSAKNFIFSPYSISTATAMVMLGTRGKTEKELKAFLQHGVCNPDTNRIHLTHRTVRQLIETPTRDVILTVANKIFPDRSFTLRPSYSQMSQYYYGSSVQPLDFHRNPHRARSTINRWASDNTNGIIKNLLPAGSVNSLTRVVLANAIYFKGTWKTQFDPRKTVLGNFHADQSTTVRTEFMVNRATYKYASNGVFSLIELPYSGNSASMIIILPKDRFGLSTLEKNVLNGDFLRALTNYGHPTKINVRLPKFKLDYEKELTKTFSKLGVKTLFNPAADFSAMTESKRMFISEIRHKTFIEVNEEGTEAAAVTAFAGTRSLSMGAPTFSCDHPFLFYIVHNRSKAILFLGRYVTPTK